MEPKCVHSDPSDASSDWQKTNFANLIRYRPNGMYYFRVRVQGRLIRRSLKTDVLSVAKLCLNDKEKKQRQASQRQLAVQRGRGQMTLGEALQLYLKRLEANPDVKPRTKE